MDIIAKTQEAHDEFVRSVQTVAHTEHLSTALNAFHTQANEVDAYIQGELRTKSQRLEELNTEVTGLEAYRDKLTKQIEEASSTQEKESIPGICDLCGKPMPEGEEMFKFHGYSGPCPTEE